jgi:hypothetical protein
MVMTTRPPAPNGPANRLPRPAAPADRGREIRLGVLGALGLLVLITGVPALLVIFVGYPLPTHAPSHAWLTQSISQTLIIKILACVVWLVWAHFVVCLLTEWRAVRRGRLPGHVALGGGSQVLARRLVALVLLLGGAATAAFPYTSGGGPAAAPHAAVAAQHPAASQPQQSRADLRGPAQTAPRPAEVQRGPHADATKAGETKYYVVLPPHGRRYDSLWDIASRTLNDPLRYKEIFALNKDRVQADGRKLVDANLILPGWELRLPGDASGPGVHVAHASAPAREPGPAPAAEPRQPAGPENGSAPATAAASAAHDGAQPGAGAGAQSAVAAASSTADNSTTSIALGGALMLAGVLVALGARRGPYRAQTEDEGALELAADPGLAALLDRALRHLAAARTAQGRALPAPIAAWVSAEQITLNLAGGDADDPPAPWRPGDVSRSWTCAVAELAELPAANVPAPFPGVLSVGRERGYELFVDFEQAPGPIALAGNLEPARELATALAVQAATCLWSDGARVTVVGFGDGAELSRVDPKAITHVPHLGAVLDQVEREHDAVLRLQRELGVDGVLTGRQARRSNIWQPHFLVLSGPPTPDEATRLHALCADRSSIVVLVVGDLPSARWRFVVDAIGRVDLGVLGAAAQAHRLTPAAVARLAEMLTQADEGRRRGSRDVAALTPHGAVARLGSPGPLRATPVQAAASVALLGPVEVGAGGPLEPARRELLTEIVVAAALHPDGVHEAVLQASIWPRGVSDEVYAAALADAGTWLGRDATGQPCLYPADGRWHLSPAVAVDWAELRRLADIPGPDELGALQRAVALFRGEAFSATPAGRYHWLAFAAAARDAKVVATALTRRLAALCTEQGRDTEAEAVLRRGLALVPDSELLWRDLLALAGRRGPDGAVAVAGQMYDTLQARRVWPEPETDALVAQLAPGYRGPEPGGATASAG